MLAPREKLWPAPEPVADAAMRMLRLTEDDTVADFGCGDGVALYAALRAGAARAVGCVTTVYLYLIGRGLAAVTPLLRALAASPRCGGTLRVVTVLYRIPGVQHDAMEKVVTREGVAVTPIYCYTIRPDGVGGGGEAAVAAPEDEAGSGGGTAEDGGAS